MSDGEWITGPAWLGTTPPTDPQPGMVWIRKDDPQWKQAAAELECATYWGSHGCSLPAGHEGAHICDPKCPRCEAAEDGYDDDCRLGCCGFTWEPGADGEYR